MSKSVYNTDIVRFPQINTFKKNVLYFHNASLTWVC